MRRTASGAPGGPGFSATVAAVLIAALVASPGRLPAQTSRRPGLDESNIEVRPSRPADALGPIRRRDAVATGDDRTFRPTVVIRRGTSQGSGTVIAATEEATLVLTAAHVVRDEGPIAVELHRYNLGLERQAGGDWPLHVAAEVVAEDPSGDVAVLRIRRPLRLPYVARLLETDPPTPDTLVTSLGVDLGSRLSSWKTKVVETARFQLENGEFERPFLITLKIPEHGRSGGGLFTQDGRLVGVCVGHAEMIEGRRMGVFASIESIRRLLREHDLAAAVSRSAARVDSPRRGLAPPASREPD